MYCTLINGKELWNGWKNTRIGASIINILKFPRDGSPFCEKYKFFFFFREKKECLKGLWKEVFLVQFFSLNISAPPRKNGSQKKLSPRPGRGSYGLLKFRAKVYFFFSFFRCFLWLLTVYFFSHQSTNTYLTVIHIISFNIYWAHISTFDDSDFLELKKSSREKKTLARENKIQLEKKNLSQIK